MKKNIMMYGLIGGLISVSGFLLMGAGQDDMHFENGMIYGYVSMLLAFIVIFIGIKNYRDKQNGGIITFGKAFKIGFFMTLIASTVYVVTWLIDYYFFIPDFMDKYASYTIMKLKEKGASQVKIDETVAEMAKFKDMYKNPGMVILFTYMEILPLGVVTSLISAAIIKRKTPRNPQVIEEYH